LLIKNTDATVRKVCIINFYICLLFPSPVLTHKAFSQELWRDLLSCLFFIQFICGDSAPVCKLFGLCMMINGSLARRAIKELMAKGTIRLVAVHANQQIYTRATNT
jgi:hypothetical protein